MRSKQYYSTIRLSKCIYYTTPANCFFTEHSRISMLDMYVYIFIYIYLVIASHGKGGCVKVCFRDKPSSCLTSKMLHILLDLARRRKDGKVGLRKSTKLRKYYLLLTIYGTGTERSLAPCNSGTHSSCRILMVLYILPNVSVFVHLFESWHICRINRRMHIV